MCALPCPSRSQHTSCTVACRAATKGFWAEALGQGDFYYELGIQCIKVCIRTRDQNGGLMEVEEMCRLLSRLRKLQRHCPSAKAPAVSSGLVASRRRRPEEGLLAIVGQGHKGQPHSGSP